jgi:hypothetical protein
MDRLLVHAPVSVLFAPDIDFSQTYIRQMLICNLHSL